MRVECGQVAEQGVGTLLAQPSVEAHGAFGGGAADDVDTLHGPHTVVADVAEGGGDASQGLAVARHVQLQHRDALSEVYAHGILSLLRPDGGRKECHHDYGKEYPSVHVCKFQKTGQDARRKTSNTGFRLIGPSGMDKICERGIRGCRVQGQLLSVQGEDKGVKPVNKPNKRLHREDVS